MANIVNVAVLPPSLVFAAFHSFSFSSCPSCPSGARCLSSQLRNALNAAIRVGVCINAAVLCVENILFVPYIETLAQME